MQIKPTAFNLTTLSREFYQRDTVTVAKALLGKYLIHVINEIPHIAKIVEVEAYLGEHDLASHSSKGITNRTKVMFGPAGYAYVYQIYGIYYCMNVVTEQEGQGSAVLVRAVEPIQHVTGKTQGPGLLCRSLHIDKRLNAHDLLSDSFYIAASHNEQPIVIVKRPRIGVDYAKQWAKRLLRFYIKDNVFVSKR